MKFPALLHSVSYAGTWGQARLSLEEFIDKAAALGFQGVMLAAKRPHVSVLDYGPGERARLRDRLQERGLRHLCMAAYNNFTADWEHGDVPHREIQVHYLTEVARLTRDLGGELVRVFTGYEHPAAGYIPQWNAVVASLKELARRAAEFGVTIGVQNHHDLGAGWECQFDLIEAVDEPNCRALFDAWAPALHGADLTAAARKMAPLTVHTTIADYQKRPRYHYEPAIINYRPLEPYVQAVPMGEGFIDYRAFLGTLDQHGFEGTVAYEMCSPLAGGGSMENLDRYARCFLDYLAALRESRQAATPARA
jgi:sugar phosphate isomerase/epimerase